MEMVYTEKDIAKIAQNILLILNKKGKATIVTLQGDLGAGKTTLTKALAKELGVQEVVTSPTFVIAKFYNTKHKDYKKLRVDITPNLE